jgi:hypothetical protein
VLGLIVMGLPFPNPVPDYTAVLEISED